MSIQTPESDERPSMRLARESLTLPAAAVPSFDYVPARRVGELLFVSGQLPKEDGEVRITGRCGGGVDLERARAAARICALQAMACAADAAGGIDNVTGVVRVGGFVASTPAFHDQPKVIDAASELMRKVFGEAGRHSRIAVGVAALPRNSSVEIEFIFTVNDIKQINCSDHQINGDEITNVESI